MGGHPPQIHSFLSASPFPVSSHHPPAPHPPTSPSLRSALAPLLCFSLSLPPPPCQQPKVYNTRSRGGGRVSWQMGPCFASSRPCVSPPVSLSALFSLGVTTSLCFVASTSPTLVRQTKVFITANGVGAEVQDHTGLGACGSVSGVGSGGREVREG